MFLLLHLFTPLMLHRTSPQDLKADGPSKIILLNGPKRPCYMLKCSRLAKQSIYGTAVTTCPPEGLSQLQNGRCKSSRTWENKDTGTIRTIQRPPHHLAPSFFFTATLALSCLTKLPWSPSGGQMPWGFLTATSWGEDIVEVRVAPADLPRSAPLQWPLFHPKEHIVACCPGLAQLQGSAPGICFCSDKCGLV